MEAAPPAVVKAPVLVIPAEVVKRPEEVNGSDMVKDGEEPLVSMVTAPLLATLKVA